VIALRARLAAIVTAAVLSLSSAAAAKPPDAVDHLTARGLSLVWRDSLDKHVGEVPTADVLYGPFGVLSTWHRLNSDATSDHRIVARAPDGRAAIQYNVPRGNVPHDETFSQHWTPGVRHAGFAVDVWIPEDFVFAYQCSKTSWQPHPGVGRWPIGLWIGNDPDSGKIGGGVPLAAQQGVSIRLNRGSAGDPAGQGANFAAYIYYLNRALPRCEQDGVMCSYSCPQPANARARCFGAGLAKRSGYTPRGRWVTVELEAKMNDPGQRNGCAAFWVDGALVDEGCGMDFGADRGWLIRGIYTYQMWHCDGSPKRQAWWLSNIRLYAPPPPSQTKSTGNAAPNEQRPPAGKTDQPR
jgi:hypothetical protein